MIAIVKEAIKACISIGQSHHHRHQPNLAHHLDTITIADYHGNNSSSTINFTIATTINQVINRTILINKINKTILNFINTRRAPAAATTVAIISIPNLPALLANTTKQVQGAVVAAVVRVVAVAVSERRPRRTRRKSLKQAARLVRQVVAAGAVAGVGADPQVIQGTFKRAKAKVQTNMVDMTAASPRIASRLAKGTTTKVLILTRARRKRPVSVDRDPDQDQRVEHLNEDCPPRRRPHLPRPNHLAPRPAQPRLLQHHPPIPIPRVVQLKKKQRRALKHKI